jgi:hypothetical protein
MTQLGHGPEGWTSSDPLTAHLGSPTKSELVSRLALSDAPVFAIRSRPDASVDLFYYRFYYGQVRLVGSQWLGVTQTILRRG